MTRCELLCFYSGTLSLRFTRLCDSCAVLEQCSATFSYSRHTKTMSKFSRHTSAKKRRKFTHQITVTTPTLSAVQWDVWGCRNELNRCMLGSIFEMATRNSRLGKKLNINLVPTANMAYSLWYQLLLQPRLLAIPTTK